MADMYAPNYGISQPAYPDPIDQFNAQLNQQADRMNAANRGGGGGGGGGKSYNQSLQQDPSGNLYDQLANKWTNSPAYQLQAQQDAIKNQHWNDIFGTINSRLAANANPYTIGGQITGQPTINANPVFNPKQIQDQVNLQSAKTSASAATADRNNAGSVVGRGFGSSSPLLAALNNSTANATRATNAMNETNFRGQAAQSNATQVLNGQQAQEQQFANRQEEAIKRAQPYFQQTNALIAALASMA